MQPVTFVRRLVEQREANMRTARQAFDDALHGAKRNLPGHGLIDRSRVVGRHSHQRSVNTDGGPPPSCIGDDTLAQVSARGATQTQVTQGG